MKSSVALVSLATLAHARPFSSRRDDIFSDKEKFCSGWDLTTPEGVDQLWEDTAAGVSLELWIKSSSTGQNNWLLNMENYLLNGTSGKSEASGCGTLSSDECNPMSGMSCDDHFDTLEGTPLDKNSYWTFQAAKGAHNKFRQIKSQLVDATLVQGLKIDSMITDFGGDESDADDTFSWLAAACSMGAVLGGLAPGAGTAIEAGFGILSAVFSGLQNLQEDDEGVDAGSISSALADSFTAASDKLETILRIAMGGGTSDEEYQSLPAPKWDTFETNVAKFFNGGWFILNDDAAAVTAVIDTMTNNLRLKVASNIMKAAGLHLVADKSDGVLTREDCGYATGRQWMELKDGEEYCFYLAEQTDRYQWTEAGEGIYTAMAKYGLGDREPFYQSILDCAINGGDDQKIDTSDLNWGELPRCFFSLPAQFIKTDEIWPCEISPCSTTSSSDIE